MVSRLAVSLHPVAGRPLVWHNVWLLTQLRPAPERVVVLGGDALSPDIFGDLPVPVEVVAPGQQPSYERDGGGAFVIENKAAKAKYLSNALIALWAKADARTPKDDVGPIDFDPVTNSQDPDVKSFALATEKLEADKVTIAVSITGHRPPDGKAEDRIVRYDFVREAGTWKIDDIWSAVDAKPWSLREQLAQYLKDIKKAS